MNSWVYGSREPAHRSLRPRLVREELTVNLEKLFLILGAALCLTVATRIIPASAQQIDRTELPIPDTQYKYPGKVPLDARDAKFPPIKLLQPPQGAPNVVVILLDDIGFGAPSTFGGGINMPTMDALAKDGLRYTQFHTTALCSPTREALLTGRNHHSVGMGSITELATSAPGNTGMRLNNAATVAEILKLNGYNTAAFGKMHQTPVWETSISGPYTRWPIGDGFEKFYGFLGGETNQWAPLIFDGVTHVEPPHTPGYNFMTDMTDQAIAWMRLQHTMTRDSPSFVYFAPGALHAPHHTPKEWRDKDASTFDVACDKYREETLARQKQLGLVPPNTQLAPWPADVKHWDQLSADDK